MNFSTDWKRNGSFWYYFKDFVLDQNLVFIGLSKKTLLKAKKKFLYNFEYFTQTRSNKFLKEKSLNGQSDHRTADPSKTVESLFLV